MKREAQNQLQNAVEILKNALRDNNDEMTGEMINSALSAINSAFLAETPTTGRKFDLYKFTDKNNPFREAMHGIFHDGGYKVASDAHILCAVHEDYPAELEGKIIGRDGVEIVAKFPLWRQVFPKTEGMVYFNVDTAAVRDYYKKTKAEDKANGVQSRFRPKRYVRAAGNYFDLDSFIKVAAFMDTFDTKEIFLDKAGRRAAKIEAPDGSKALIMPTIGSDEWTENVLILD